MRASTARDLVGQTFGRLTVTARDGCNEEWQPLWACVCTCGGRVTVLGRNLRRGRTKSCGCLRKDLARARAEKMRTGGMLRSPKLMVDYRELEEVA